VNVMEGCSEKGWWQSKPK